MAITVNAVHRRVQYTSSGSLGPYSFAFKVLASADIRVYVGSTLKTVTTHYTTSLSADGTGSVTFTSGNAPASSTIVTIESNQAIERTSDYTTGGDFKAASINDDLDSLAINDQQLETVLSRNIQLATTVNRTTSGSGTSGPLYFPYDDTVANNASKVVSFDAAGTALIATQELGELQGNWAASTAYVLRDIVKDTDNNNIYICVTAHTSSGSVPLSSNTDSAKWALIVDAAAAATSATAAATSATAAATSATASATSATASASSATGAATSATTATTQASNASTSATAAAASDTAAANSVSAVGLQFTFDNSTTMADPGTGDFRLNHGTIASVSAIALDATSADTGNPDVSDFIATWDDSTSTLNGHLILKKKGTPATFAIFTVGAVTDNTGWLQVALNHVDSNGSWSASDVGYLQFIRLGDKGDTGSTGSTGAKGDAPGLLMAWETATADSDQGAGKVWLNHGTASSATVLYMDDLEAGGTSINSMVDSWDDSTTTALRGTISIFENATPANFHIFNVTGVVTSASTYSKVAVTHVVSGGSAISDGDPVSVQFVRTGNAGADGSGSMSSFTMSDGSTTQSVTDGQTQTFAAGSGLSATVSATDTITYAGTDASTSAKGVASFHSDNFSVSSGAVTIKDGGVVEAEIADNAVTLAKMAGGTDGNIISYDASGNPVAIATGNDGQVLTSTGAGSPPAFEDAAGGGAWAVKTSGTASSVSTLSFTGLTKITKIFLTNVTTSTWAILNMRTSTDSGSSYDSSSGDYGWVWSGAHSNPLATSDTNSMSDTKIPFYDEYSATADNGVIEILTSKPTTAVEATFMISVSISRGSSASTVLGTIGQTFGLRMSAADFDAIQIGTSSGTFGCDYTVVELN